MASRGYLPVAVSAESMTASLPSKMALVTSLASALVGVGALAAMMLLGRTPLRLFGSLIAVVVTTVLQTSAGRMIFSKLKSEAEGSAEDAAKRAM